MTYSNNFVTECRSPAYKNRLGRIQIGDDLLYLTVKERGLVVSNDLKISGQPTNYDKEIGYLSEIEIEDECYSNGCFLGTAIAKSSKFKVLDIRDLNNTNYVIEIGVKYDDNSTEYINLGKYITQNQTIDKTEQTSQINGMDFLSKLDNLYECSIDDWSKVTVKDLLENLCDEIGIELGTSSFINQDLLVSGNKYQKDYTFRDVLSDICEVSCSYAELGEDNKLYLNWFDDTVSETITKEQYSTLEKNAFYGEVNCLVIKMSAFEGENVTVQDDISIAQYGETQIAIIDNNLLDTEELRQQAIIGIWNRIKGFKYVDCKIISYTGMPYLTRGKKIRIEDTDGTFFETYVMVHKFKYDGTFYSEISSPSINKEETQIKNTNLSPKQRLLNAEAKVLKDEARIELLVEKQEEIKEDLDSNYYNKETTDQLILDTAGGLINKYTVGGGNNIFRNTGLYFDSTEYNSGFEFWTGSVIRVNNDDSQSKTSMYLQNGILNQKQEVTNDTYSISFKYNKLEELASCSVIINENTYNLSDSGTFVTTLDVNTNLIDISFDCDVDNGYEIYELMVNYGETALNYSQNQNETKTDTVEISEGIKIRSTTTDSTFRANADGIRVEDINGNTTTEFLDKGMKTNDIQADQGTIAGLFIEEVDGQTWITRIG